MKDDSKPEGPPGIGVDRMRVDDAIYTPFNPGPIPFAQGEDGLPTPNLPTALPLVAPLVPQTMVCIADKSLFVTRDQWGEMTRTFYPEEVRRAADGRYYVDVDKKRGLSLGERLRRLFGWRILERLVVEPIRPQCKFLARQMVDFTDAPDHQMVERLCTARRDSESFFLSVANSQVHACELRDPRHPESDTRLDRFDEAKIKLGRERWEKGGEFDVDAALERTEEEANRGLRLGGIFKE